MKCKYYNLCKKEGVICHNPNMKTIPYHCQIQEDCDDFIKQKMRIFREMQYSRKVFE